MDLLKLNKELYELFFYDKKIMQDGQYVFVKVVKGGLKYPEYEVDVILGVTIISIGVFNMLIKGIGVYFPYFQSLKK